MKISGKNLKKLIKEAVSLLLKEYEQAITRDGDKLFLIDDDGNEEYFGDIYSMPEYEHLEDGDSVPFEGDTRAGYSRSGGFRRSRHRDELDDLPDEQDRFSRRIR
jgi:hypothetical protein